MVPDLAQRLMWLGFKPGVDFDVQDDGNGPYIKHWFSASAQPSEAQIDAATAPVVYPDLLPYQFRAMLALSGKQSDLDAYIAGLSEPTKTIAQAKLDYSLSFQRDNDLVLQAQSALGLTDAQLDALWQQAAQIT